MLARIKTWFKGLFGYMDAEAKKAEAYAESEYNKFKMREAADTSVPAATPASTITPTPVVNP